MQMIQFRRAQALIPAVLAGLLYGSGAHALAGSTFDEIHSLVKRQPGESRWMEIDWYPSVWEARKRAAAEGKPIFLMAGSGGAPAAGC